MAENVNQEGQNAVVPTLFLGESDSSGNSNFLAFQYNYESARGEVVDTEYSRSVYFLGCILSLIPGIARQAIVDLEQSGISVEVGNIPSCIDTLFLEPIVNRMPVLKSIAIMGYLVLTMFKPNSPMNFSVWTQKRMRALYAVAGHYINQNVDESTVFMDIEHATEFKTMMSRNHALKVRIVNVILQHRSDPTPFGAVCNYVAKILSWTGMSSFQLIHETFIDTQSPILNDSELRDEANKLRNAARVVMDYSQPQFFRILQSPSETRFLDGSNFPKLIALARRIKGETEANTNQFRGTGLDVNTGPLAVLFARHQQYMSSPESRAGIEEILQELDRMWLLIHSSR